jgi:ABC-type branched-subunit amino acid transport system ATPase component
VQFLGQDITGLAARNIVQAGLIQVLEGHRRPLGLLG